MQAPCVGSVRSPFAISGFEHFPPEVTALLALQLYCPANWLKPVILRGNYYNLLHCERSLVPSTGRLCIGYIPLSRVLRYPNLPAPPRCFARSL